MVSFRLVFKIQTENESNQTVLLENGPITSEPNVVFCSFQFASAQLAVFYWARSFLNTPNMCWCIHACIFYVFLDIGGRFYVNMFTKKYPGAIWNCTFGIAISLEYFVVCRYVYYFSNWTPTISIVLHLLKWLLFMHKKILVHKTGLWLKVNTNWFKSISL